MDRAKQLLEALSVIETGCAMARAALTEPEPVEPERVPEWIETWEAAERFGLARDTVRYLARDKGFGEKRGSRWLIDATALRDYLRTR